jgi:Spy/CpxP family protein refolding chaperone
LAVLIDQTVKQTIMKKMILSLALVAGIAVGLSAQNSAPAPSTTQGAKKGGTPEERAARGAERAAKDLGLSADQKSKWQTAALERINANAPLHEKMKGSTTPEERKSLHQQAKANNEKFDNTVKGFLTPDQNTKYEQMKADRKQKMKEHHKGKAEHDHPIDDGD